MAYLYMLKRIPQWDDCTEIISNSILSWMGVDLFG